MAQVRVKIVSLAILGLAIFVFSGQEVKSEPTNQQAASTCQRELRNANVSISKWGENMENMVNESQLPSAIRDSVHNEANNILDMIETYGEQIDKLTPSQLASNLVNIRRRANRMALDIYLNTFDMRWPQNSFGLGIAVERVQQACLDRQTIQALETPSAPLAELLSAKKLN